MPSLFDLIRYGAIEAPSRLMMAPMMRGRATGDHVPTPLAGRAGLADASGIWSDAQVEARFPPSGDTQGVSDSGPESVFVPAAAHPNDMSTIRRALPDRGRFRATADRGMALTPIPAQPPNDLLLPGKARYGAAHETSRHLLRLGHADRPGFRGARARGGA